MVVPKESSLAGAILVLPASLLVQKKRLYLLRCPKSGGAHRGIHVPHAPPSWAYARRRGHVLSQGKGFIRKLRRLVGYVGVEVLITFKSGRDDSIQ